MPGDGAGGADATCGATGAAGAARSHDEELRERLRLSVLEELEVLARQVADELAVRVGDDDVEPDDLGP